MERLEHLVIQDLHHRIENSDGFSLDASTAILDAYDTALDMCLYLRHIIEQMTIGNPKQTEAVEEEPHFRAARLRADDEFIRLRHVKPLRSSDAS